MSLWVYRTDQEEPAYVVEWRDRDGNLIDFSPVGYTFELKLVNTAGTTTLTKTTNITGVATSPNVRAAWAAGELAIAAGDYRVQLKATLSSRDRVFKPQDPDVIRIVTAPT